MTISQALRQYSKLEGYQLGKNDWFQESEKQASMKIARQIIESGMDLQSMMKFTDLTYTKMSNMFKD